MLHPMNLGERERGWEKEMEGGRERERWREGEKERDGGREGEREREEVPFSTAYELGQS